MLTKQLRDIGLHSQKYKLEADVKFQDAKDGKECRQIRFVNTARTKILQLYINFYSLNSVIDQSNDAHGITINIVFKNSEFVADFDKICFEPIKALYTNHCYTKDNHGRGENFISIFTYDKEIAKNFLLSIQKFDALDGETRKTLSDFLSIEIPDASADFTPIDTSLIETMYAAGERQCRMR